MMMNRIGYAKGRAGELPFYLLFAIGFLAPSNSIHAQDMLDQETIASHLMVYIPPTYPSIAIAAQVQGDVVLEVEIAPDGLVRLAKAVSGPPMLLKAAADAVGKWRYQPFHQGNASMAVAGKVLVSFTIDAEPAVHTPHESTATGSYSTTVTFPPASNRGQPDETLANRLQPVWEACSRGVIAHSNSAETADACKSAGNHR